MHDVGEKEEDHEEDVRRHSQGSNWAADNADCVHDPFSKLDEVSV